MVKRDVSKIIGDRKDLEPLYHMFLDILYGVPKVFNFIVPNTKKDYNLNGYAKKLIIHNAGPSDIIITFPDSGSYEYTIPSGNDNANPLIIDGIDYGKVDKLTMMSNGVETKVEVVALMWGD